MRRTVLASTVIISLISGVAAHAQDHQDHQKHMAAMAGDQRQLVEFPPEMRQHTLASMRDHLQALSEILSAMSSAQYDKAASIATTRLGLTSPSAAGCREEKETGAALMSKPASMEHQMAQVMPEGMRNVGLEMHTAASTFAAAAAKAGQTRNARPALAALARVTEQCAACHAAYKVQ